MQRYYGLNLVACMREGSGYSPRQILILIRNLPLESATMAALRGGDEFRGWGMDRYLMASLIDAVRENTFVFISANSKKKPKTPEPTYRPEKAQAKKKGSVFASMARLHYNRALEGSSKN